MPSLSLSSYCLSISDQLFWHWGSLQHWDKVISRPRRMRCLMVSQCRCWGMRERQVSNPGIQLISFYILLFKIREWLIHLRSVLFLIYLLAMEPDKEVIWVKLMHLRPQFLSNFKPFTPQIPPQSNTLHNHTEQNNINKQVLNSQLNLPVSKAGGKDDLDAIDCDEKNRGRNSGRRIKKQRKTRTLITKDKLMQMNKTFAQFVSRPLGGKDANPWSLKLIAEHLELGYSTVLHKFRQFRSTKKVKAGTLISSLQKKRKYKKSLLVQRLIKQAMSQKEFFTASQITAFIQTNYGRKFSRSIISRHLGELGFSYRNVNCKIFNEVKIQNIRKSYVEIMRPLIQRNQTLIFIDQLSCCIENKDKEPKIISVLMACTIYGVLYFHIQEGFVNRENFFNILKDFLVNLRANQLCNLMQGQKEELYLVLDCSSIHRDCNNNSIGIASMLIEQNTEVYYIPPKTPEFNPLEPIFDRIRGQLSAKVQNKEAGDYSQVWQSLELILQQIKEEPTEDYFFSIWQQMKKYLDDQTSSQMNQTVELFQIAPLNPQLH